MIMNSTEWATILNDMLPASSDATDDATKAQWKNLAEYIMTESDGVFRLEALYLNRLYQQQDAPWSYIFDVLKYADRFVGIVKYEMPKLAKVFKSRPAPGYVFAKYDGSLDALRLTLYTGKWRTNDAGFDGYGRDEEVFEVIECTLDRDQRPVSLQP